MPTVEALIAANPGGITVWRFADAPAEWRALSPHGGDEDWLALVPAVLGGSWIPWLEDGGPFGRCEVSIHLLSDGSRIYIGAHA